MTRRIEITGNSAPTCECNPEERAKTAIDELIEMIDLRQDSLPFEGKDVEEIIATYHCGGPNEGECLKFCGQIVTASLFDVNGAGLSKGSFISQVLLD